MMNMPTMHALLKPASAPPSGIELVGVSSGYAEGTFNPSMPAGTQVGDWCVIAINDLDPFSIGTITFPGGWTSTYEDVEQILLQRVTLGYRTLASAGSPGNITGATVCTYLVAVFRHVTSLSSIDTRLTSATVSTAIAAGFLEGHGFYVSIAAALNLNEGSLSGIAAPSTLTLDALEQAPGAPNAGLQPIALASGMFSGSSGTYDWTGWPAENPDTERVAFTFKLS